MWIIGMLLIFAALIAGTCAGMHKGVQIHNSRINRDDEPPAHIVDQLERL